MQRSNIMAAALLASALLSATGASADNNRLVIKQSNNPGEAGNTLFVDQSNATGSAIGGLLVDDNGLFLHDLMEDGELVGLQARSQEAAVQNGSGNDAEIVVLGSDSTARLSQVGDGNSADITLGTALAPAHSATAIIGQQGSGNQAELTVLGSGSVGAILQRGSRNEAGLTVQDGLTAGVAQIGDDNIATNLVASGTADVQYIQIGNGLEALTSTEVTSNAVVSNGASITIIQRAIGTP